MTIESIVLTGITDIYIGAITITTRVNLQFTHLALYPLFPSFVTPRSVLFPVFTSVIQLDDPVSVTYCVVLFFDVFLLHFLSVAFARAWFSLPDFSSCTVSRFSCSENLKLLPILWFTALIARFFCCCSHGRYIDESNKVVTICSSKSWPWLIFVEIPLSQRSIHYHYE